MKALQIIKAWGLLALHEMQALEEDPEGARRLAICTQCPHLTKAKTCSLCGCFMPAKVLLSGAKCANHQTEDYWNNDNDHGKTTANNRSADVALDGRP